MSDLKHTPGDWMYDKDIHAVISKNCPHEGNIICISPSKDYVSYKYWGANAKLIAAAPEMLSILQNIIKEYDMEIVFGLDAKKIRDIIKKATS